MHRRLKWLYGCNLRPYYIDVTLRDPLDPTVHTKQQLATLAPYEVFSALHAAGPAFKHCLLGDNTECTHFWAEAPHHPANSDPELLPFRNSVVPTYWHADGGEVS
jgi:hypothetical protein